MSASNLENLFKEINAGDFSHQERLPSSIEFRPGRGYRLHYADELFRDITSIEALCMQLTNDLRKARGVAHSVVKAWWMNDNHTFVRMSLSLADDLISIHDQWEEGFTHGSLFIDTLEDNGRTHKYIIHAHSNWTEFVEQMTELYQQLKLDCSVETV